MKLVKWSIGSGVTYQLNKVADKNLKESKRVLYLTHDSYIGKLYQDVGKKLVGTVYEDKLRIVKVYDLEDVIREIGKETGIDVILIHMYGLNDVDLKELNKVVQGKDVYVTKHEKNENLVGVEIVDYVGE